MGKITGFLEFPRKDIDERDPRERIGDYREIFVPLKPEELRVQGSRCMDCGVPFCQADTGCPLGNIIPDWNDLVYRDQWEAAIQRLHATNNFPEMTGRICPAPCEQACTLNINTDPVTIKQIERAIADTAWERGWLVPQPPLRKTGKRVAVVGSGPAGLAAAQQLARAGHSVTVFEKQDRVGGLLRYGIPDFKMNKVLVDRRMAQMEAEGVTFRTGVHIGRTLLAADLVRDFDAVVLAGGSESPRDLPIPGRELRGVHFAMDFLRQQNKRVAGDTIEDAKAIMATGRKVVVIGGGDTGSDCIATSHRHGAELVVNLELMPQPPAERDPSKPWPWWPYKLYTSYAHKEGGEREFAVLTKAFRGDEAGRVRALQCVRLEWSAPDAQGRRDMREVPGSEFEIETDLVLLAMGFTNPVREGMLAELEQAGLRLTPRGEVATDMQWRTSIDKVFCAGDMTRGQSLVVQAISDGRRAARAADIFLMGSSELPAGPRRTLPNLLKDAQ